MAGGKLSPRQKMINMMYLVLTALLAMNVSSEILNAFKTVNRSLNKSINVLNSKNKETYAILDAAMKDNNQAAKAAIWKPIADEVRTKSDNLYSYLERLKEEVKVSAGKKMVNGEEQFKEDDLDVATRLFIEEQGGGAKRGKDLYEKIEAYKKDVVATLRTANVDAAVKQRVMNEIEAISNNLPINLEIPDRDRYGAKYEKSYKGWTKSNFYQTPAIAAITILTKIQNDIKNTEGEISNYCANQLGKVVVEYDQFAAVASANTTYCMPDEELEITAGVGAFNDKLKPSIVIGGTSTPLNTDGVAIKKIKAGSPNTYTVPVSISFTTPQGEKKSVNKTITYTVGQPSGAALMLDKMNVFYIGLDNPVTVSSGTGDERTKLSASGGGITLTRTAPGKYNVRATTIGEATITVSDGKQNTPFKFRVKRVPDPIATIGGVFKGGKVQKGNLQVQQGVKAILENFDFDAKFTVKSFEFTYVPKNGDPREGKISGERFNADWTSAVNSCKPNDVFLIENVKVIGPDGTERKIPGLSAQIKP